MRIGSRYVKADWGHLALATVITAMCVWYLFDARTASASIQNMILILPATVLVVLLFAVIVGQELRIVPAEDRQSGSPSASRRPRLTLAELRIPLFMALLGVYVFSLPVVGFDLATFLFLVLSLLLQGERRPLVVVGYSLIFAVAVTWAFKMMLTVSVPTRFW